MTDYFDLTNKKAVVTGAGRGIGLAIARRLAEAGADILVAEYSEDAGQVAVDQLREMGHEAHFVQTDVRDVTSVQRMAAQAIAHFGQVDLLVNNAGIVHNTPAEDTSDEEWRNVIDVNINGVFWCSREIGKHMLERERGVIVNIASMSGIVVNNPQPQAAYNVSKAGVIMLTKSLAAEWARRGIRVNSVSPGYIGTEMTKRGMSNEVWREMWLAQTPMNRVGDPVDVANAVLYLASDAAAFATGTNLVIDGGYTSW